MALFEWTIPLLVVCVALAALARRLSLPYPSLLAVAGAGIAFLPFAQPVEIEPDLALALFVAPVLLDGAFNTSPRDLNRHLVPLTMLALAAVLVTAAAVAFVGWKWFGIPLAAAVALGAIVAPPDAVAASAVLDDLHLPRRLLTILQGESLWNDATALYLYRIAILWAGGSLVLTTAVPLLLLAAVASVAVGYGLARLYLFATIRVRDPASVIVLQFVGTFGVWILSERLGLSAIVTVVVYAMTIARLASGRMSARLRISSYSVWETAVFVLNVLAFLFMGLQARPILQRLADESLPQAAALSAATLATVIVVRLLWVLLTSYATRGLAGKRSKLARESNVRSDLVIGWCGMRGIVTLAAAFGLPGNFPARDMIVLAAFVVVLGTLVLQGATLEWLIRRLGIETDGTPDIEVSQARIALADAALAAIKGNSAAAKSLRMQYNEVRKVAANPDDPQGATAQDEMRLHAIERQRAALQHLRRSGKISDETYHRLQEEIDWAELNASPPDRFEPLAT